MWGGLAKGGMLVKIHARLALPLALVALVAGCSQEVILEGERLDRRSPGLVEGDARPPVPAYSDDFENRAEPVSLPPARANADWPQLLGNAAHHLPNPAFSGAPSVLWQARIGQGNDRKHHITASPVVGAGRVFTLDAEAGVMAHTTAGAPVWSADVTPPGRRRGDASGGGLALGAGKLFVTSGFGALTALDAATGALVWRQALDADAQGAPAYADGVVYLATKDAQGYAIDAENGRILWQVSGIPDASGYEGVAAPAILGGTVVFGMIGGELVAADRKTGERRWLTRLAGERLGRAYVQTTDVTGQPVMVGKVTYAANPVGRSFAIDDTGAVIWQANEGALDPMAVAGGAVFLVSDENRLIRLDAATGAPVWAVELPYYKARKLRRRTAIYAHRGPVVAGGLVWLASSDGLMRGYDPVDGALAVSIELPDGAVTLPALSGGTAYVVTRRGLLLALR